MVNHLFHFSCQRFLIIAHDQIVQNVTEAAIALTHYICIFFLFTVASV